jgi:Protein of unknown function (DUF1439)
MPADARVLIFKLQFKRIALSMILTLPLAILPPLIYDPIQILMTMRRKFGLLICVLGASLLAGCASGMLGMGEIKFTHAELTERLARRFPLEKTVAGLLDVSLTRPRINAREESGKESRLAATFDVQIKMALSSKVVAGVLSMSGKPRYDSATRSIFIGDVRVDSIRVDNMPDALSAALAKAASSIARDNIEDKPLRTFTEAELTRFGLTLNPQRIDVRSEGIALVMK